MKRIHLLSGSGVAATLLAALLFGAATPLAKALLDGVAPFQLAGLFYLGAGLGLTALRWLRGAGRVRMARADVGWLAAAILTGGVVGPVLLMFGLSRMPASGAALLLNAESVFTALLAWIVFREGVDRRVAVGMLAIVLGIGVLGWPAEARFAGLWPTLAVLGACLAWGLDNNFTRKLALADAQWLAAAKGLVAGSVNLALGLIVSTDLPPPSTLAAALGVGFVSYGLSLSLFIVGLRHLGTARAGAYFSVAPFFGAVLAVAGGEPLTGRLMLAGLCIGIGVWLHLTERHSHEHRHAPLAHSHEHVHDAHHQHEHPFPWDPAVPHTHWHEHEPLVHAHPHLPDAHHQDHTH
jgi:drug/metabolite transporter (DMT)-like permease